MVEHSRGSSDSPVANPDRDRGIAPDVLDPAGRFASFGEQVDPPAAYHEPNFDFARQTRRATGRG